MKDDEALLKMSLNKEMGAVCPAKQRILQQPPTTAAAAAAASQMTTNFRVPENQARVAAQEYFNQILVIRSTAPVTISGGASLGDALGTAGALNDLLNDTVSGATAFGQLINAAGPAMEGLLHLGTQVPMFGSFAGSLLMFYDKCKAIGDNSDALVELFKLTKEAGDWVTIIAPNILDQSSRLNDLQVLSLNKLCSAIVDASNLISIMSNYYSAESTDSSLPSYSSSSKVTNTLLRKVVVAGRNFTLSDVDSNNISSAQTAIKEALESFKSSLSAVNSVQNFKSTLSELDKALKPVDFTETRRRHLLKYCSGSREWLYEELISWLDDVSPLTDSSTALEAKKIFWFQAGPGMGKSVFSAFLMSRLQSKIRLLGGVFFMFNKAEVSNPYTMMLTLAFQIATVFPELQDIILKTYNEISRSSELDVQLVLEKLILEPLGKLDSSKTAKSMVIVFDALDETGDERERSKLLEFLSEDIVHKMPYWVKLFITGRPEEDICAKLYKYSHSIDQERYRAEHIKDLRIFISKTLEKFRLSEADRLIATERLMQKSDGCFMFLPLVTEDLDKFSNSIAGKDVTTQHILNIFESLPNGIDECYSRCLDKLESTKSNADRSLFLQLMVACREALSIEEVKFFSGYSADELDEIIAHTQTIFPIRDGKFYPFHKSIIDYLVDPKRNRKYLVSIQKGHALLSKQMLSELLAIPVSETGYDKSQGIPKSLQDLEVGYAEQSSSLYYYQQYMYKHLIEHLHQCNSKLGYQYIIYCLLTSLPWLQSMLSCTGMSNAIDTYFKIKNDTKWLELDPNRKRRLTEINILWKFLKLLSSVNIKKCSYSNWFSEICTQITCRLQKFDSERILQLVRDAETFIRQNGGWIVKSNSLLPPGGTTDMILQSHTLTITSVCTLRDGCLATGSYDETLRIWNLETGEEIILNSRTGPILSVCCLDDGRIATGSNTIQIWNLVTQECFKVLDGHTDIVNSVCSLSDCHIASGSKDNTVRIWNFLTGDCDMVLNGHTDEVMSVCSVDNKQIASASLDRMIRIWNIVTGNCDKLLKGHTDAIVSVHRLSVDRIASGSYDNTVRIWNVLTCDCIQVFKGHTDIVNSVCSMSDGRIVSGSRDSTVRIWNTDTGDCYKTFQGHSESVWSVCALSDGRIASGSRDKTVRISNILTGNYDKLLEGHTRDIMSVCVLKDGRIATGSKDSTTRLWNLDTGKCEKIFEGHTEEVRSVCSLRDGRIASGSYDCTIRIWNVSEGGCDRVLNGHDKGVISVCVISDNRLASGSFDETVRIWNVLTGMCDNILEGHTGSVWSVCSLSDGRIASGSRDSTVRIWNVDTCDCENVLEGHTDGVISVCIVSDKCIATGSYDETVRIWDIATGKCEKILKDHTSSVRSVFFLDEHNIGSSSDDGAVRVWNLLTGDCIMCTPQSEFFWSGRMNSVSSENSLKLFYSDTAINERHHFFEKKYIFLARNVLHISHYFDAAAQLSSL